MMGLVHQSYQTNYYKQQHEVHEQRHSIKTSRGNGKWFLMSTGFCFERMKLLQIK